MLWRAALPGGLILAALLSSAPARAEGGAYRLFIAGPSLGEPSTAKQATAYTLYGLAGVSTLAGGYFLSTWSQARAERDDFNAQQPTACLDFASSPCARAGELQQEANQAFTLALGSFALGATFALSGVVVAHQWPNLHVEPKVVLSPSAAFAGAALRF